MYEEIGTISIYCDYNGKLVQTLVSNMSVSLLQCMRRLGPFRWCGYNGKLVQTLNKIKWLPVQTVTVVPRKQYVTLRNKILCEKDKILLINCKHLHVIPDEPRSKGRQEKDKVPHDFVFIFQSSYENYIKIIGLIVPLLSYLVGTTIFDIQSRFTDPEKEKVLIDKKNVPFVIGCSAFAIILITCLTKVYRFTMFRMYKHIDSDLFIGVVPRWFLWTKNFTFRPADIKRFPPSGYIRFVRGDVQIKGRPFVLDFAEFALPKYYNEMVGYDVEASGRKFEEDVIIEKFKRRK
ncbi:unnamed protein product [Mytilus edulis]|uniref:Uncharacterized protein n=1 Tax=Mytilus edulis TaxID=6550 RepID=A0A8S3V024_MYTED|nr:unnamed protein product [Mytilus edulis]